MCAISCVTNPVVKASLSTPVGVPILDWMAVPKRDLMQTPIYQEWGRRNGVHAMANVVLLREATQFANFNLIRSPALGDFEQHDLKWLDLMAPHLRRAVEMNRLLAKLDRDRYAAYAALEHLKTAVLLLGADGYVVHMNAAAVAMVNAKDGLELSHNRLHAAKPDADRALARMMHVAAFHLGGQGGTAILPRPSGRRALVARIYPLVTRGCFVPPQGARVIVFLTDPEVPLPSIDHVARAYGLTKAEARLVPG